MRRLGIVVVAVVLLVALSAVPAGSEPPQAPTVASVAVGGIGETSATVTASITPNGFETTYHVEYGLTEAYGTVTPEVSAGAGSEPQAVSVALSALAPATSYHARVVATNAKGPTVGGDVTFTTLATPDRQAPQLTQVFLTRPRVKQGTPTDLRLTLSEPARINVLMERLYPGRQTGWSCKRLAKVGPRCFVRRTLTTFTADLAGGSKLTVPVPVSRSGLPLARSQYRLTVTATDAAGNRSAKRFVTLVVR